MALPTLDSVFASAADLPRRQMLAKWLVEETETGGNSSVAVSDAGSSEVNGTYTYRGEEGGKPYYNLVGEAESPVLSAISWSGSNWVVFDSDQNPFYISNEDVEFPWMVETWNEDSGEAPAPTVNEIPPQSPTIADYYTLPERYLWAKIAVAAGAPRSEADYISLPKNYAWSDIYNAVSGDIANSVIVLSGAGQEEANGSYFYVGITNGYPKYNLNEFYSIEFSGGIWTISADGNVVSSFSSVAYPWLATGWSGDFDATNLVLTPQTPNHTDWSENVALGHIAAAYRGDTANPANLATYIDWPWRYQVASIITAL
jgi:hypothetical protein